MVSVREEGTSGHWAVRRKGAAEVGLGGGRCWLSLAHQPPRLPRLGQEGAMLLLVCTTPSQIQMRGAGRGLPLC